MISPAETDFIRENAYLPEQFPDYAAVVSGGEPFLAGEFVFYLSPGRLIFVGFPLRGRYEEKNMARTLEAAVRKERPGRVTLIAPTIPPRLGEGGSQDTYYRLDLKGFQVPGKVQNMIRRASRELQVAKGRALTAEHLGLISDFSATRALEEGTRTILARIPEYLSASPGAWVFSARTGGGELAGFDIAEFGPSRYAFYLFNFRSRRAAVPGTSDLLLAEIIRMAKEGEKEAVNLGLRISPGVAFFKEKWGGRPFLEHRSATYRPGGPSILEGLLAKL